MSPQWGPSCLHASKPKNTRTGVCSKGIRGWFKKGDTGELVLKYLAPRWPLGDSYRGGANVKASLKKTRSNGNFWVPDTHQWKGSMSLLTRSFQHEAAAMLLIEYWRDVTAIRPPRKIWHRANGSSLSCWEWSRMGENKDYLRTRGNEVGIKYPRVSKQGAS